MQQSIIGSKIDYNLPETCYNILHIDLGLKSKQISNLISIKAIHIFVDPLHLLSCFLHK
jgi:hypothetical protein